MLNKRTAAIIGATGAINREIARAMLGAGWAVYLRIVDPADAEAKDESSIRIDEVGKHVMAVFERGGEFPRTDPHAEIAQAGLPARAGALSLQHKFAALRAPSRPSACLHALKRRDGSERICDAYG